MNYKRFLLIAVTTVITTSLQSVVVLPGILPVQQVFAQSTEAQKAEAKKLFMQGAQQSDNGQYEAALKSFKAALIIFREIKDRQWEATTLLNLGIIYINFNNAPKANEYLQKSLVIAREIKDNTIEKAAENLLQQIQNETNPHKLKADKFLEQGAEYIRKNQFELALEPLQKALVLYRKIKDRIGEGKTLGNLGLIYGGLREYAKAIKYHEEHLQIAREMRLETEWNILLDLGSAYASLGNYAKAIEYLQQSLIVAQKIKNTKAEGQVLGNLGLYYKNQGDYLKAIEYQQKCLQIARQIKDREMEVIALSNLGNVYSLQKEHTKAIEYHQQSLQIWREIKQRQGEGKTLGNLGLAFQGQGNNSKALEYMQQSLAIAQEIKDAQDEMNAMGRLGQFYLELGQYSQAINYYQKPLIIARQIKDPQRELTALISLGNALYFLREYAQAIDYFQQHLLLSQDIKDRKEESLSLLNLGSIYYYLKEPEKAINYSNQSLKISRAIQDRATEGNVLVNLGLVYNDLGYYDKAITLSQQALTISREVENLNEEGSALGNLGLIYSNKGDYSKAIEKHQQSLVIFRKQKNRLHEAIALRLIGSAYYEQKNYPQAINYQQQALAIAKSIGDIQEEGFALTELGSALFKSGKLTESEKVLIQSVKLKESVRKKLQNLYDNKVSIFEAQYHTYRLLQQVLVAQNKTDVALEIAERSRGRTFIELLKLKLSTNIKEVDKSPEAPKINQIKQIAKAQNATLVQYSIIGDYLKVAGKQQWKESQLYIWVIKPTGEITFRKVDLKPLWQKENTTLSELVSTTRKSLGVSDDERSIFDVKVKNPVNEKIQRESLQKLHQLLIKPIADLLPTDPNQRVTFVPQEDLFLVPFPALMDSKGEYLIEQHTILTAPAIQVLELTRSQQQRIKTLPKSSRQNALIVGNPTMPKFNTKYGEPGKQLSSLPGAKREAEAIAPLFNTKALTGDEATETTIKTKLPQAGVIHLATHGLFDGFQGLQSSIALAPSSQDNGLLTASEILDIKLNADLVVLSACNTGRGRITGDGVIGLSRSLFLAGTPSVLVSLWSVPDAPTAELMTDFYQNLYQKNLDKAQALRQAMLTRMKQHPNPRDWAAFTLIGEAE